MALTLRQSRTIQQVAAVLAGFLPGSGSPTWKNHVSFQSIAADLGLAEYWPGGAKTRSLEYLLSSALENRTLQFELLIRQIVKEGLTYRTKQSRPLTRAEIESLNGLLLDLNLRYSDLWDPKFLDSLEGDSISRAAEFARSTAAVEAAPVVRSVAALMDLRDRFFALCTQTDRQAAGFALERLLNELFDYFGLDPKGSFKIVGEQIDGSFVLVFETYLAEAKWTAEPVGAADLYVFREKVEGKSAATRGIFVSINGFSEEGVDALTRGKQPVFFLVDGADLAAVLQEHIELPDLLRRKQRVLAQEGRALVSVSTLLAAAS